MRVEQQLPCGAELREVGLRPPADEHVPVGQRLDVALAARQQRAGVLVLGEEAPLFACVIESRIPRDWDGPWAAAPLSKTLIAPSAARRVVLVGGRRSRRERDVGVRPPMWASTWPLEVLSSYSAEVLRAEISVVPSGVCVDRVDVEVVQRPARLVAGRAVGLAERDVVEAVPLASHEPRSQVEFLEDAVGDGAVVRPADRRRLQCDRVEDRQQGGALRRDLEVVQVGP